MTFQILRKCATRPISPTGLERPPQASAKRAIGGLESKRKAKGLKDLAIGTRKFIYSDLSPRLLPLAEQAACFSSRPKTHAWPSRHRLKRRKKAPKVPRRNGHHTLHIKPNLIAHRTRTAAAGERQKGDERIGKQAKGQGPKRFGDRDEKIYLLGLIAMAFTACGASRLLFNPTNTHAWPSRHRLKRRKKAPKVPRRNGHHTFLTQHNPIQRDSNGRRRRATKGSWVELVFGNSEGERLVLRAGGKFT